MPHVIKCLILIKDFMTCFVNIYLGVCFIIQLGLFSWPEQCPWRLQFSLRLFKDLLSNIIWSALRHFMLWHRFDTCCEVGNGWWGGIFFDTFLINTCIKGRSRYVVFNSSTFVKVKLFQYTLDILNIVIFGIFA